MIASLSFTGIDSFVADEFTRLRTRARGVYLLSKIVGRRNGLKSLAFGHYLDLRNKRNLVLQYLP